MIDSVYSTGSRWVERRRRFAIITSAFLARCSRSSNPWLRDSVDLLRVSPRSPRHGISTFLGKKQVAGLRSSNKNLRSWIWRHVLRQDHTRGSLVSTLSPFYVFLISPDFCACPTAPPSSQNRRNIDYYSSRRSMQFRAEIWRSVLLKFDFSILYRCFVFHRYVRFIINS